MSTQFPDGNAADAPHVGDASGSDANPTAGATISPGKSARSFARPTVASTARSSALPRATGSANLRQISNPAVPGAFGNEQLEQQGYDADSDNDEADITQIHHLVPSRPLSPVVDAQDSSDSFQPSPPNVTTTRGRAGFQYPALRQRSDAQRTDNPLRTKQKTATILATPSLRLHGTRYLAYATHRGTTSKPVRKVIGYPTLAAYEYDANGEPRLVGELDEAFVKGSTTEAGEKLYQFCFDTVHTLHNDLANLQERLTDAQEDLIDERVAKLNSEKQVKFLTNQLQEVRGSLHVANQDLQSKLDTAERRAERYLQRKEEYKTALNQESTAHGETKEKLKAYASTARPSLRGKPHDSISDESDGPVSVRRHRSATKLSPDAPLPATTQRRSKQPEPAVFEGPTGTKASTYQKWKLDMQSWFRAHPYPFANNEEEQLDYIRMKTTGVAWDNISSGWFVEGDEFHTAQEACPQLLRKEGFMKPGETITSYLARFKAGVAPLKWDDEEKTLQAYKKLPDQWRSRAEHLMSDDTFTKDFAKFSHKLRHLEQLHSALQPSHNPSKGNSGGSGANQFIINKPYRERTVMETQVLAELERCFKCTRAGHKSNSDDAPCKDMDKLTSMGRYPEVLTALNEARKAAGVPILRPPYALTPSEPLLLQRPPLTPARKTKPLNTPEPTTPPSPTAEDCDDNDTEPDPTLQAILDRIKNLERPAAPRVRVSAIAAAAIRGNTYLPMGQSPPEDFEKFRDRMERPHMSKEEILAKLPEVLHPLYHGFDPREADEIPPQRDKLDHAIEIQLDPETGKPPRPSSQRLRPLSRDEARAVKLYIDDMIRKGHIEREAECDLPSILSLMHESGEGMSRVGTAMVRLARLTLQGQHDPYDDLVAADEMTTQEIVDALYPTDARLTAIRDALNNGHRRILTTLLLKRRAADSLTNRIDATRRYLRDEIAWTQERMKDFADVHRHPAPRFAVGDWVLLNAKHIKTERPVKSLDHKNMGPYQITRVIDNMAYELDLPDSLKNIFPAFHPWLLQPYEDDALPGQPRANDNAPPEVHLNDEGDTELPHTKYNERPYTGRRGCLQYKVEWVGNDQSEGWQPYFNLRGSKESVQDFHDRNPGRPGPHATFHDYDDNGQLAVALLCVFNGSLNAQSGL
ncbi:hypothetical protein A1F94_010335 [Pyrenophora tritici-repentis]|nr:hypothetical protein A1F94_010335 [Pyrenophora tritici-repentis]